MVRVEIKRYGKTAWRLGNLARELMLTLDQEWFDFQVKALETGQGLHNFVKEYIRNHAKRPGYRGKIANAISYEEFIRTGEVEFRIGNIAQLDEKTDRAWRAVNWGSSHMVEKQLPKGYFRPGKAKPDRAEWRKGRWYRSGGVMSKYAPIVKRRIPPMYFVEELIKESKKRIGKLIAKTLAKIKKRLGK